MTLVLPVPLCGGGGVRALVSPSNNDLVNNNSSNNHSLRNKLAMPCGFDGEPLDFESALMLQGDFGPDWSSLKTPWSNGGNVSEITANPFPSSNVDGAKCSVTTTSILRNQVSPDPVSTESSSDSDLAVQDDTLMEQCQEQCNKRKTFSEPEELTDQTRLDDGVEEIPRKRCRTNSIDVLDEPTSRDVSVTSLADDLPLLTNTSPPLPLPSPPKDVDPISPGSCAEEEDLFTPRRRVPMLWSPRLRLKDERRRVLKMSLSKLRKIEDPELFLRRSVLVNNTMKRLQREIRDERFAKYHQSSIQESNNHPHHHNRHPLHHSPLSYGMDVQMSNGLGDSSMMCKEATQNHCNNPMTSSSHYVNNLKQSCWGFDNQPPEDGFPNKKMVTSSGTSCGGGRQTPVPAANCEESNPDSSGSSSDEGSSCDEMFGINEDFLRIHIPKSPPTPVNFDNHDQQSDCVAAVQPSLTSSTTHHQCQQQQHDQNLTSNKIEQHTVNQLDRVRVGHVHLSSIERPLNGCDSSREDDSRMLSLDNIHHHHHHHDNHDHHRETDNVNRKNTSRDDGEDLSRTTLESLSNCGNRYIYDHQTLGSNHHHASSGQCSAQYRTLHHLHHGQQRNNNQDSFGHCGNENSYSTPAMPILDSVVYHSLLASLDT